MNHDQELKLQSYLDGELSAREAKEMADWLATEPEARLLFAELQSTKTALAGSELQNKLPESREFFWSKIEREIQREQHKAVPASQGSSFLVGLRKLLAPLAGAAALCLLIFVGTREFHSTSTAGQLAEVESLRDDMSLMTFRSQSEQLTVVWHQQRNSFSETASDITLEQQ